MFLLKGLTIILISITTFVILLSNYLFNNHLISEITLTYKFLNDFNKSNFLVVLVKFIIALIFNIDLSNFKSIIENITILGVK